MDWNGGEAPSQKPQDARKVRNSSGVCNAPAGAWFSTFFKTRTGSQRRLRLYPTNPRSRRLISMSATASGE